MPSGSESSAANDDAADLMEELGRQDIEIEDAIERSAATAEYPKLVSGGKLRGYWLLAPGVFQPPCGFSVEPPFACLLPKGHEWAHYMADTSAEAE